MVGAGLTTKVAAFGIHAGKPALVKRVSYKINDRSGRNFQNAKLAGAKLAGADLSWAKLGNADLRGAELVGATLVRASLSGADLREADLTGANLDFVTYFNLGVDCRKRGDKHGAIKAWTEALSINPNNPYAYYDRGVTKAELGDYIGAFEDFNQAIYIHPRYSNAYLQRDKVRRKLLEDNKTFLIDFEDALKFCQRGKYLLQGKKYTEAIKNFDQALQLNPNIAEAYYNRAKSRYKLKDREGAIEDFQKAAKLLCDNNKVESLAEWTPFELGESNRKEAIPYIVCYLFGDSSYEQRRLAVSAIHKLAKSFPNNCESAIPYLLENLSNPAPQVRQYALKALSSLSLPDSAIAEIAAIAEKDPKEYNRTIAKVILNKITTIEDEQDHEMNWVEYEDYLGFIERDSGLTALQKIDLINGRKFFFGGKKVDYKGYLTAKASLMKGKENTNPSQFGNNKNHKSDESEDLEYEVYQEQYDTFYDRSDDRSIDYGYLNDFSNPYEYF